MKLPVVDPETARWQAMAVPELVPEYGINEYFFNQGCAEFPHQEEVVARINTPELSLNSILQSHDLTKYCTT